MQFLAKTINRVLSDRAAMTSQREQGQVIFASNGGMLHIRSCGVDHDEAFYDFIILNFILIFLI